MNDWRRFQSCTVEHSSGRCEFATIWRLTSTFGWLQKMWKIIYIYIYIYQYLLRLHRVWLCKNNIKNNKMFNGHRTDTCHCLETETLEISTELRHYCALIQSGDQGDTSLVTNNVETRSSKNMVVQWWGVVAVTQGHGCCKCRCRSACCH